MVKYIHMLSVSFDVISEHKDDTNLEISTVLAALLKRVAEIQQEEDNAPGSVIECFVYATDIFEIQDEEAKNRQKSFHY